MSFPARANINPAPSGFSVQQECKVSLDISVPLGIKTITQIGHHLSFQYESDYDKQHIPKPHLKFYHNYSGGLPI